MTQQSNNFLALKLLVFTMGLTMIFGVMFISYIVFQRLASNNFESTTACDLATIELPAEYKEFTVLNAHDNYLYIQSENKVLRIDVCSGIINRTTILK